MKRGYLEWGMKYLWNNDRNHQAGLSRAVDYMNLEALHGVTVQMEAVIPAVWAEPVSPFKWNVQFSFLEDGRWGGMNSTDNGLPVRRLWEEKRGGGNYAQ